METAETVHLFLDSFTFIVNVHAIMRKLDGDILESTSESMRPPYIPYLFTYKPSDFFIVCDKNLVDFSQETGFGF